MLKWSPALAVSLLLAFSWIWFLASSPQAAQEDRQKWEYKVDVVRTTAGGEDEQIKGLETQLNEHAAQGWELQQIQLKAIILKRAK